MIPRLEGIKTDQGEVAEEPRQVSDVWHCVRDVRKTLSQLEARVNPPGAERVR